MSSPTNGRSSATPGETPLARPLDGPARLSDYDVLALDERGQSMNACTERSPCGVQVEAYATWLNFVHAEGWRAGSLSPPPVVATVREGEMSYLDCTVLCVRGPQLGAYFAAWHLEGDTVRGMAGLTCVGAGPGAYEGVRPASVAHLRALLARWAVERLIPQAFASLPWDDAWRFNQGDARFARGIGAPIPATPVGAAEPPVFAPHPEQPPS